MRRWLLPLWTLAMAIAVAAPWLRPGYVLNIDMVFTPHQALIPWMFGLDGGLPRAVPEDAIVGALAGPLPGQVLQKVVLLATLWLAGLGAARLMREAPLSARLIAASIYQWSPWLAERLVIGHWALSLAYAAAPWLVDSVLRLARARTRQGTVGGAGRVLLWAALASWVPTGGVIALVLATGVFLRSQTAQTARSEPTRPADEGTTAGPRLWVRLSVYCGVLALSLPWIVPSLLHRVSGAADPLGVEAFRLRPDGPWGSVLTALSLGGVWNGDAVPFSRAFGLGVALSVVLLLAGIFGLRRMAEIFGRGFAIWLTVLAALSILVALGSGTSLGTRALIAIPGAGILRDAQKPLVLLAIWFAVAAPLGLLRWIATISQPAGRRALVVLCALAPLLAMPDFAWGVAGRLSPVSYPQSWTELRSKLGEHSGAVASLPWSTFRRYGWNDQRSVTDPLPRFLAQTVVTDWSLLVYRTATGEYVRVAADDARSNRVSAAIAAGERLDEVLPRLGIDRVVVQTDQPQAPPEADLSGMTELWRGEGLVLLATSRAAEDWRSTVPVAPVAAANLLALLAVAAGALGAAVERRRQRRGNQSDEVTRQLAPPAR